MSDPRIQGSGNPDYTNIYQNDQTRRVAPEEEEFFQFSDDDKKITREVDNTPREIRVGHDKEGNKFRYTDDTHEVLVTKTTAGKDTYLTKTEFDRQVKDILQVRQMPEGIRAEFRNGCIVFIDKETNLSLTASELRNDPRVLAAQDELDLKPIDTDIALSGEPRLVKNPGLEPIDIRVPINPAEINRDALLSVIKENPNDYLPILSELYGNTKQGKIALQRLVRDNFDIRKPSGATAEDINKRLAEVKSPMRKMGQLFLDAEQKYGVNAWAILSVIGIESSYGKNKAQGTSGNFIGLKHRNSNSHRELRGSTKEETYRNNINAVAHQLHLYNTRGLNTPYDVAKKYCDANKGPWSNFMATEIMRGQGDRGAKPDESLLAQLKGGQPKPQPQPQQQVQPQQIMEEVASVKPFNEPDIDELQNEYTNIIGEITVTGSLAKVKRHGPVSQTNTQNGNDTES